MKRWSGMKKDATQSPTRVRNFRNQNLQGTQQGMLNAMQEQGQADHKPHLSCGVGEKACSPIVQQGPSVAAGLDVEEEGRLGQIKAGGAKAHPVDGRVAHQKVTVQGPREAFTKHCVGRHLWEGRGLSRPALPDLCQACGCQQRGRADSTPRQSSAPEPLFEVGAPCKMKLDHHRQPLDEHRMGYWACQPSPSQM